MIALLSIPNTGTWFTLNLLLLHPEINYHIDYNSGFFGIGRKELNRYKFKYIGLKDNVDKIIYRRHIMGPKTHGDIDLLCMGHKAIIPMRDPLASLISKKNRNPIEPAYEHVEAFEYIATSPWAQKSFFFPIDTDEFKSDEKSRHGLALDLFDSFLNIPIDNINDLYIWAKENEPKNAMEDYPERQAYLNGDIERATAKCKGEFEYLKSKKNVLIPFLKQLGYKDLMWW